jgi:cardiolipin synthase
MDMRSFYLNLELSLILYEPRMNTELGAVMDTYVARSTAITQQKWAARPARQRFLENLLRLAGPLL